jgi:branched-chain amino acid transport system ATP-binding protein
MKPELLTLMGVSKHFGGVKALQDVDLTVEEGKISALIGPNGAGKTTLFNVITGVYPPTEGKVYFEEENIDHLPTHKRVELGMVRTFQLTRLFKRMTVLENVMVGRHIKATRSGFWRVITNAPRVRRQEAEIYQYAMEMLQLAGIAYKAREQAGNLPHGQQRLLEMARSMAAEPRLILLDEPAAGLNPLEEEMLKEALRAIIKRGTTILLVEHDMRLVMDISEWVNVLNVGRKIAEGTPQQIGKDPVVVKAYLGKEY